MTPLLSNVYQAEQKEKRTLCHVYFSTFFDWGQYAFCLWTIPDIGIFVQKFPYRNGKDDKDDDIPLKQCG